MNERIRELAEQAREYADENRPGSFVKYDPEWFAFYNKKFAELIVQECIHTVESHGGMGGAVAGDKIRKQFGVKS